MSSQDFGSGSGRRWTNDFILAIATRIFRFVAIASLIVALAALAIVVVLYLYSSTPVFLESVPPEYVSQGPTLSTDTVNESLAPPQHLRFTVVKQAINAPITTSDVLGYFEADTPVGLAPYPDDFEILGGKDAGMFERTAVRVTRPTASGQTETAPPHAALRASQALVEQINSGISQTRWSSRSFEITVAARNRFGNSSPASTVRFSLSYGPPAAIPASQLTPLEQLARDIASRIAPAASLAYADAYNRATREPDECGASGDTNFMANYRAAFERVKSALRADNIEAFYAGVCVAWRDALAQEASARANVDAVRARAMQHNAEVQAMHWLGKAAAYIGEAFLVWFVSVAITVFLVVSLAIAFLGIERHLRAIRGSTQTLADNK